MVPPLSFLLLAPYTLLLLADLSLCFLLTSKVRNYSINCRTFSRRSFSKNASRSSGDIALSIFSLTKVSHAEMTSKIEPIECLNGLLLLHALLLTYFVLPAPLLLLSMLKFSRLLHHQVTTHLLPTLLVGCLLELPLCLLRLLEGFTLSCRKIAGTLVSVLLFLLCLL